MSSSPQNSIWDADDPHVIPHRYLTEDIAGIGGLIKQRPEDFMVDEIPLYEPEGHGEHIYLYIQKIGISSFELIDIVAKHFGVHRGKVGYAGMKDKQAITRQVLSVHVPGKRPEDFPQLQHPQIEVQWIDLHVNKLRRGHLRGNRFNIRIRDVDATAAVRLKPALDRLAKTGVPNRLGEQRFGKVENNHLVGRALALNNPKLALDVLLGPNAKFPENHPEARELYAQGRYAEAREKLHPGMRPELTALNALAKGLSAEEAVEAIDHAAVSFYLSAFQSAVFNAVLDRRVDDDTIGTLLEGDIAIKHDNRALFDVDAAVASDPDTHDRLARFQISPTGPMWGSEMKRAAGAIDQLESDELLSTGVHFGDLERAEHWGALPGSRRPLRVPVIDPDLEGGIDEHGPYVRVAFELPRGSFATVVLRELMKPSGERASMEEASAESDG